MKALLLKFVISALLFSGCAGLFGQCAGMIDESNKLYINGHYEKCIFVLEELLKACRLSRSEKEDVLELLAKSYVEIKDQARATQVVEEMLKEFPHHELNESENFESYNRLVKKYNVHPALSVGARNVIIWLGYNSSPGPEGGTGSVPYSGGNYFFSYYGWAEYEFDKNISINGDLMWWTSYFNKRYFVEPNLDLFYSENPVFVEIPIYAKKYFPVGAALKPYIAAGIGWLYMTESTGYASKYDRDEKMNYWDDGIDVLNMRNRHNFEWIASAGLGYKIKNVRLFFDLRYYRGITSLTDPEKGDVNELLRDEYHYIDQPLKMNKFETGVSISYTFINSVKRVK